MPPGTVVDIEEYGQYTGNEVVERILKKADSLKGVHVANVNSTFYGGGVAELLSSLTILMNMAGVKTGWRAIQGSPDFFSVTKKMHNALQGGDINLSDRKKEIYEDTICRNALHNHLEHHDIVVIHDPQPLPMINQYRKSQPWIWRCHVDLTNPHRELWEYLLTFVERYDAMIVSSEQYAREVSLPQMLFRPALDPFNIKNKELNEEEMVDRLEHYDIPRDKPLVVQVARFDKWKDPEGVIQAFKIAQKEIDARLVLLGNIAMDDPEGEKVYNSLLDERSDRIRILSVQDTALVNSLQRKAAVVVQKSIREGFGLTVTEAMWKGAAVVAANVGGIPTQIEDGVNGFLVDSVEQCAERMVELVQNPDRRKELGEKARRSVMEHYLLTRLLEQYFDLFQSFEPRFTVSGLQEMQVGAKA
ncbi:MAG: glycosyltransferase [Oceanidesulfovibrio sp.]